MNEEGKASSLKKKIKALKGFLHSKARYLYPLLKIIGFSMDNLILDEAGTETQDNTIDYPWPLQPL